MKTERLYEELRIELWRGEDGPENPEIVQL